MFELTERQLLCCAIILIASFTATTSFAQQDDEELHVLIQVRNPDLVVHRADGSIRIDNRASRLLEAVLAEANLSYDIEVVSRARIKQGLATQKNVLSYPIARTPDIESMVYWVGRIRPIEHYLYGLKAQLNQAPTSLDEARNLKIGLIRGDTAHRVLANEGFEQLLSFDTLSNALTMMERNRFDLFAFEATILDDYINMRGLPDDYLVPTVRIEPSPTESYFALSTPTDSRTKDTLTAAYERVVENGSYARIMGSSPENCSSEQLTC